MAPNKTVFQTWHASLPIPWLVGGPNGQAESAAWPALMDAYVSQLAAARYCSYPDLAPVDALSHIGGDRQLEQGTTEASASLVTRLKAAWDDWARGGTALELLVQLYWGGFSGAIIVQQNGLAYTLSGAPTAGVDPTSLLSIAVLGPNAAQGSNPASAITINIVTGGVLGSMQFSVATGSILTGTISTLAGPSFSYTIPGTATVLTFPAGTYTTPPVYSIDTSGNVLAAPAAAIFPTQTTHPWWTFDGADAHTSRFAVLLPSVQDGFITTATATFTGAEDGSALHPWPTATWNHAFSDTTYKAQAGITVISDGGGPVICDVDLTSQTRTSVRVTSSAPFVGTVDLLAWRAGANPYCDVPPATLAVLARLINRWRPGKALCMGVWIIVQGPVWGYPTTTTWGQSGLKWGQSSSAQFGV